MRWRVLSGTLLLFMAALLMLPSGCGDNPQSHDDHVIPYTLADRTTVIPQEVPTAINGYNPADGMLTLDAGFSSAAGIDVGDIVIGQDDGGAPAGFLRRVTAKSTQGDAVVLETAPATLVEAFEAMEISETHLLRPSDVRTSRLARGARFVGGREDESFTIALDCVLYDEDGDPGTADDRIELDGEFSFTASLFSTIVIAQGELQQFELGLETEKEVNLSLAADLNWESAEAVVVDLAELRLGAIPLGGVVYLVPTLTVEAHVYGDLTVALETAITCTETVRSGFGWQHGDYYTIRESSKDVACTPPDLTDECDFEVGPSLALACLLYGVSGTQIAGRTG
ncbi:MAG: hypothetical protein JXA57_03330, partial [Armatimonadetes bacterium]|nr:hypothetical protein [Armatimonadota bacterium]